MADVPLDRVWTLFVLARRDHNYDQGVRPVLRIATPRQLWEAWDGGLDAIVALLLDNARVVAAGARMYGVALFAGDARPEWDSAQHRGGGLVRIPLRDAEQALQCVLFALGDRAPVAVSGLRILSGRSAGECRVELWVRRAADVARLNAALAAHGGTGTPQSR